MDSANSKALYLAAVKTLAAQITRNKYGDIGELPIGSRFITGHGKHTRLHSCLRATQVEGWGNYGPIKSVGYVVTDEVLSLYDAAAADLTAQKKADRKLSERQSAKAAGYATIAAWKREKKQIASAAQSAQVELFKRRLAALGLDDSWDNLSEGILGVLEEAQANGFEFNHEHIHSVRYAAANESAAWSAYQNGDMSASDLLHRTERARHRHEKTNYECLLREGFDREDARDYATAIF